MIGERVGGEAVAEPVVAAAGPVTEQLCLPGKGLTLAELLRVLDVLRRRLARHTRGQEGAFAGFDVLDVSRWQPEAEAGPILFTARRVADDSRSQVVEYAASACLHHDGLCHGTATAEPFVRASGTTIGLGRTVTVSTDTGRFAMAPSRR